MSRRKPVLFTRVEVPAVPIARGLLMHASDTTAEGASHCVPATPLQRPAPSAWLLDFAGHNPGYCRHPGGEPAGERPSVVCLSG